MNKILTGAFLLGTTLIAACGGGGGGNDSPPAAATYTIGGSVSGLTASGLVLQVNGVNNIAVTSGATSFTSGSSLTSSAAYQVTVSAQPATQTCTVSNGSGTVASTNVTNVAITCVTNTFAVGATVSGLTGTGLLLQLNAGAGLSVTSGSTGLQTFANRINAGTNYTVTVQTQPISPIQQCTVANGSGTNISANVTNVTVTCINVSAIAGVAAVGSPLSGTVTVKDANGLTRTSPIGSNGSYTADVAGMTAPFVFRAEGSANGHTYVVHSAALAADVGGNINITQLTDLIVDNIAGQVASAYFDNGNFSALTTTALNAEVAILKQRLLPVLTALGVDASIDLLRSRFTPLSSALDSALDILRVSVDTVANVATITNIVTQQAIQDTITIPATAESNPPQLDNTSNVASAITDTDAIKAALTNFATKFATGLLSVTNIQQSLTTTFLQADQNRDRWAADLASNPLLVGLRLTDIDIRNIDYTDPTQITAILDVTANHSGGSELGRLFSFRMRKGTDGVWRLHGDQRVLDTEGRVQVERVKGCTKVGWIFRISEEDSSNTGTPINHIMVWGPGLPSAGVRYVPPTSGGGPWNVTNAVDSSGAFYVVANSCSATRALSDAGIAAIPDNAGYIMAAYSSADNSVRLNFPIGAIPSGPYAGMYWVSVQKRPPTLAEAVGSTQFPTITSPASEAALATYTGGPLLISATGINTNFAPWIDLGRSSTIANWVGDEVHAAPTSTGTVSATLTLPALATGDSITLRRVSVSTKDVYRRQFESIYELP